VGKNSDTVRMHPRHCSYAFLLSFIVFVFLLQWNQRALYPAELWQNILLLGLVGLLACILRKTRETGCVCIALALGIASACGAVARTTHGPTALSIDTYATEQIVEVRGRIVAEPDRRPMQTKYTVETEEIRLPSGTIIFPVHGKILATDASGWPEYSYGDAVVVRGTLEKPGEIELFSYDRYLSRFGVYAVIYRASLEKTPVSNILDPSLPVRINSTLFAVKRVFESQINRLYAEPHASFMAGLLTGSRRGIPEHLMDVFNTTGLTHIIAISGYNITIVIAVIAGMLFWLPLKIRFFPAVAAIAAFTLFVGASAAVVRASIMGILGLLALQTGRQSEVRLAVLWTLFLMLLWNPKELWYDAGFQLSFLAVLGLTEIAPHLDPIFKHIPKTLGMREALQMTVAAQLSAVPLILFLFGRLSLIAPIANLLVAPFIPFAMLFGFCGTVASFFWFPLGQLIGFIGWGCLEWIIFAAESLANLPLASIEPGRISTLAIVIYYLVLGTLLSKKGLNGKFWGLK